MDTQRQNFWKESINNEVLIRNRWFQQHIGAGFNEKQQAKPRNIIKVQPLQIKTLPGKKPQEEPPTKNNPAEGLAKKADSEVQMRVASAATRTILYTGLSAEGDGRKAYLIQRKNKGPEEKYQYPLTSALEVGWKISEVSKNKESKPAQYGRSRIVQDTFFRTNGVL